MRTIYFKLLTFVVIAGLVSGEMPKPVRKIT